MARIVSRSPCFTGALNSNTANVLITVVPVNDIPLPTTRVSVPAEGHSGGDHFTGSDVDGNTLSYTWVKGPVMHIEWRDSYSDVYTSCEYNVRKLTFT